MKRRRLAFKLLTVLGALVAGGLLIEGCFRVLEWREARKTYHRGPGGSSVADARWGWKPAPGPFADGTPEFDVTGEVNAQFMNDDPLDPAADAARTRVLALGDSHTFAVGVSRRETWPKVLERELAAAAPGHAFRVYNAGCYGYSLHQYLLRLHDQGPLVHPDYVAVGLSYASDLYDLMPADRGGWVYGGDAPRDYFDFDDRGALVERHYDGHGARAGVTRASTVRAVLDHFATFRYLRRSKLALAIGSRVSVGGQSLWPNMDVVLARELSEQHQYAWRLAEALLLRMRSEAARLGARLIVVGIPYLPQVYDEIWNATFGGDARYSRTAAIDRLRSFCAANDIAYVDALEPMRARAAELGRWVHHRKDAHPTPEGQAAIAHAVATSNLITPAR